MENTLRKLNILQKVEMHLEPKRASTMELFSEYSKWLAILQ